MGAIGHDQELRPADGMDRICRVTLFGPFRLAGAEGRPIVIQGRRTRAILAYLLLSPKSEAGRERLAALFWGDRAEAQARASLRQCLAELRSALEAQRDDIVIATRETVGIASGAFDCDVADLRAALAGGDWRAAAQAVSDTNTARLLEDLDLSGPFSDWLEILRAEVDAEIAQGLARHVQDREAARDWAAVKTLSNAWLRRDPFSEPAMAALIRAELSSGSRAAAQIRYNTFRAQLAAELGVEPGPMVDAAMRGEGSMLVAVPAQPSAPQQPLAGTVARAAPPQGGDEIVLAVLPFDNLSADGDLAWFCDGVAEEIQRTVARATEIKVLARASSFQFRGADKGVASVSAALGTTHLLDGSVRQSGPRVRINAELVECTSHRVVWSERFDGDFGNVFELQDRIAEHVSRALAVTFARSAPTESLDPEVCEVFLRARSAMAEGDAQFDDSALVAIPLLEMVTQSAPDYAPGWELLATARAAALRFGRTAQPYGEGRALVLAAADTALRLDPARGGAYSALAMLEPWGGYAAREALLRKALELGPRDPTALTDMSNFCWSVGRFREALAYAEQACELNPLMPAARLHGAQMRTYVGDYEASIRMIEDLHARWPKNARILTALMDFSAALGFWDAYDRAILSIASYDGVQRRRLESTKRFDDALRSRRAEDVEMCLDSFRRMLEKDGTLALNFIMGIGHLGRLETAFELAERSSYDFVFDREGAPISAHYPGTIMGRWSPIIRDLRGLRLLHRVGLCDYWLTSGKWPDCVDYVPYDFKAETLRIVRG